MTKTVSWISSVLLNVSLVTPAGAQRRPEIHCEHFLFGYPLGVPASNDLIIRDVYAPSNDDTTRFADRVAYRIGPGTVFERGDTSRRWRADPWLDPGETLKPSDYENASAAVGIDRGHQAPLASFAGDLDWRETNHLPNIAPQQKALNQGPWNALEQAERDLAKTWTTVWVMTGPLYARDEMQLPNADEEHRVPAHYWKIVAIGDRGRPGSVKATAFVMDQSTRRSAEFYDFIVRIDEVEQKSDLDFFWLLPNHTESQIESEIGTWPP